MTGLILAVLLPLNSFASAAKIETPPYTDIDNIVHNKGNIAVNVENWGIIGDPYGINPSGEWPRNSGHDYLAEIKYWMGAITPDGDTIVSNTDDDFRPIPSLQLDDPLNIRLSTDTTRFNYDPTDTVGLGLGNPAYGWRVYNADSSEWIYNYLFNTQDSTFYPGGPTGLQQSYYRFDDANVSPGLGLQVSHNMCQWNYCYNEDIIFVIMEITNTSAVDYSNFVFAVYCDFDIGGLNDLGENGRLGDMVAFDSLENLAWTYDEDGYDEGWKAKTGIMGTKYLETPDDIGMTSFRTGQWELLPDNDPGRYELINTGQFDASLPPTDQYYLQCTRGIDLTAGKTVRVVFALIAGENEEDFYANASTAQTLYDNNFVGPQPPQTPTLRSYAADNKVYLMWNDTSETDIDPLTGDQDFKGYKLYRSVNQGYTWGEKNWKTDNDCLEYDYVPIFENNVNTAGDPIQHSFVDSNLINGVEYWYCLVSFDAGDTSVPIDALQNGFGHPDNDVNVVRTKPRSDQAGFYEAISTVEHTTISGADTSFGVIYPIVMDRFQTMDDEYNVVFTEDDYATYWNLIRIDEEFNDTTWVLENQSRTSGDPNIYEVAEGIRVVVQNDVVYEPLTAEQTGFATAGDTTLDLTYFFGATPEVFDDVIGGDIHFRSDYEIRFTATGSIAFSWFTFDPITVPFEVWNTTRGYQVNAEIYDQDENNIWEVDAGDFIIIVDYPYDDGNPYPWVWPQDYSWIFGFDVSNTAYATGDVFTLEGAPLNGADDVFTFRTDGVDASDARAEMKNIKVAPDPYLGHAQWETNKYQRKLQFINLPDQCTIRIYTLGGDLVNTINHDGTTSVNTAGTYEWNMLSKDGLAIASGIYFYHVESEYGNRTGRFAVIM